MSLYTAPIIRTSYVKKDSITIQRILKNSAKSNIAYTNYKCEYPYRNTNSHKNYKRKQQAQDLFPQHRHHQMHQYHLQDHPH